MLPNVTSFFASSQDGSKIKRLISTELEQLADNNRGEFTVMYLIMVITKEETIVLRNWFNYAIECIIYFI